MSVSHEATVPSERVRFGVFEVDFDSGELFRRGRLVPLQQQPFQVLAALLSRPGELVTREELRQRLWPDEAFHAFDDGLNTAVLKVRQALGDSARDPRFVETLPGRGYRFIAPLATGDPGAPAPAATRRSLVAVLPWIASGVLAAAIAYVSLRDRQPPALRPVATRPVTTAPGLERSPSFTPDGQRVVYASDQLGQMDVWIRQLGGGPPVVLTADHAGFDDHPRVSPDGTRIAFVSTRDGGGIFVTTSLGGPARRLARVDFVPSPELGGSVPTLDWSPQGSELVYALGVQRSQGLFVLDVDEGRSVRLRIGGELRAFSLTEPVWSPDGERIAFVALGGAATTVSRILTVDRRGRRARAATSGKHHDRSPVWLPDGSGLLFVSDRGGAADVWQLALGSDGERVGEPVAVTTGVGVGQIALSPDGRRLVYVRLAERSNLWRAALDGPEPIDVSRASPVFRESQRVESVSVSVDGEWLAFDSDRTGDMEIWLARPDGSELRRITEHPAQDWYPSLSPRADRVVFHSLRDGNRELYVVPVAGGPVRRLTDHPAKDWVARWSPRREEIAFTSERSGNPDVWLIDSRGGEPWALTVDPANDHNPMWTPTGEAVVFTSDRSGASELYSVSREGGTPRRITSHGWLDVIAFGWSADGGTVHVWGLPGDGNPGRFWAIRDGVATPLVRAPEAGHHLSAALASAGGRIYFPMWERIGDLWIAELASGGR